MFKLQISSIFNFDRAHQSWISGVLGVNVSSNSNFFNSNLFSRFFCQLLMYLKARQMDISTIFHKPMYNTRKFSILFHTPIPANKTYQNSRLKPNWFNLINQKRNVQLLLIQSPELWCPVLMDLAIMQMKTLFLQLLYYVIFEFIFLLSRSLQTIFTLKFVAWKFLLNFACI